MKKIIALVMTLFIAISISSIFVLANGSVAVVKVLGAETKAGESVNVTVSLENCSDITSLSLKMVYDSSALELTGGNCLVDNTIINQVDVKNNVALFKFDGENVNANGNIFEFTFKIDENAKAGTYEISFDRVVIKQLSENKEIDISADKKVGIIVIKGVETETTTAAPTTQVPTTAAPTTAAPTAVAPTTEPSTEPKTTEPMVTTTEPAVTTTEPVVTTTEPTTDNKIPQTGESTAVTVLAGVLVLAGVAFIATKKKEY